MTTISIQEMQRDPLGYMRRVEGGETFLVVRDNLPVAKIKPVPAPARGERPFGLCAGEFTVPADFDAALSDEVLQEFEGE
jgi:antitoxin (DNA-binding transcriptional repressor) of toxin-antitoxin stability system